MMYWKAVEPRITTLDVDPITGLECKYFPKRHWNPTRFPAGERRGVQGYGLCGDSWPGNREGGSKDTDRSALISRDDLSSAASSEVRLPRLVTPGTELPRNLCSG